MNIGQYYLDNLLIHSTRTFWYSKLNEAAPMQFLAVPTTLADSAVSTALGAAAPGAEGNFNDGGFETLGAIIAELATVDPADFNGDPFFTQWLSLMQSPNYLLEMMWDVTGDAHAVTQNDNTSVELHLDGSIVPSIGQAILLPPMFPDHGYYVDLDLQAMDAAADWVLTLNGVPWPTNGDGHYSIPLVSFGSGADDPVTLTVGISAPAGQEVAVRIDNLAITVHPRFVWQEPDTLTVHVAFMDTGLPIQLTDRGDGHLSASRGEPGDAAYDVATVFSSADELVVEGSSANDELTLALPWNVQVRMAGAGGEDVINVNAGNVIFLSDLGADGTNTTINVAAGATVLFASWQHLAALNVNGGDAAVAVNGTNTLVTSSISITAGSLDSRQRRHHSGYSPHSVWCPEPSERLYQNCTRADSSVGWFGTHQ